MAKNNQIKPESSREDVMEDDSSSSGEELDKIMEPVKLNFGKNKQSVPGTISDSDSGSESESGNEKEKKIDEDWFEKSQLLRSILKLGNHFDEEIVIRRWNKVPMKKRIEIANEWDKLEKEKSGIASLKARLGYEIMSAITEATT